MEPATATTTTTTPKCVLVVEPTTCYCGAELSQFSTHGCSEGCDWSGITPELDDTDAALDSGCECGHHRRLRRKAKQNKRKRGRE